MSDVTDQPLPEPDPDNVDNCENPDCGKPLGGFKTVDAKNRVVCYSCAQESDDAVPYEHTKPMSCTECDDLNLRVPAEYNRDDGATINKGIPDSQLITIIEHYQERHADSQTFRDIVGGIQARVTCTDCQEEFAASVQIDATGGLGFRKYCGDCAGDDDIKQSVVRRVDAEDVVRVRNAQKQKEKEGGT